MSAGTPASWSSRVWSLTVSLLALAVALHLVWALAVALLPVLVAVTVLVLVFMVVRQWRSW